MAGRRRTKKLKTPDDPPTCPHLLTELLELIFSHLNLRANIGASAVCKKWLAVAISVRKPNETPWLMFFPKSGDLYEFYDPSNCRRYCLEFPELHGAKICYSKDGWLLLSRPKTQCFFFVCPYNWELINLPKQQLEHEIIAFSAAPTSPSCVVFTVKNINPYVCCC